LPAVVSAAYEASAGARPGIAVVAHPCSHPWNSTAVLGAYARATPPAIRIAVLDGPVRPIASLLFHRSLLTHLQTARARANADDGPASRHGNACWQSVIFRGQPGGHDRRPFRAGLQRHHSCPWYVRKHLAGDAARSVLAARFWARGRYCRRSKHGAPHQSTSAVGQLTPAGGVPEPLLADGNPSMRLIITTSWSLRPLETTGGECLHVPGPRSASGLGRRRNGCAEAEPARHQQLGSKLSNPRP